jgi:hypothetical protein
VTLLTTLAAAGIHKLAVLVTGVRPVFSRSDDATLFGRRPARLVIFRRTFARTAKEAAMCAMTKRRGVERSQIARS